MSYQLRELVLPDGSSPYADWFSTLDSLAAAKLTVAAASMEPGNLSIVEWFRGIGECKIDWGPGYRIYLAKDGLAIIVLLGGGSKKRQQRADEKRDRQADRRAGRGVGVGGRGLATTKGGLHRAADTSGSGATAPLEFPVRSV